MKPYLLLSYLLPFAIFFAVMTVGMTITDEQGGNTDMTKAEVKSAVSDWVVYPEKEWIKITPAQAGFDVAKFNEIIANSHIEAGAFGGVVPDATKWGAVLTRGGYMVQTWGDPEYKYQSASLGKSFTRAVLGLAIDEGLIKPDDLIKETWTGEGQLSHPHKYLNQGYHKTLTWDYLINHQGGFILESGYHWRTKTVFHASIPEWAKWTGDPLYDNYAHTEPATVTYYSSGGYWRLSQALTALWDRDIKQVLDEKLFSQMGIPADRWEWTPGKVVHDTKDWYPAIPNYGEYVDPPYEINGHVVRGGPGWIVMSSSDMARVGLLIATGGVWKGKRLINSEWLRGHAGLDIHLLAGDPDTYVSIGKANTKGFPFGNEVGTKGLFSFPKDLIISTVVSSRSTRHDR
jgi:CubicO group peptidase (beta-lactamase class C family)